MRRVVVIGAGMGWITVATVANVTSLLDYLKWDGFGIAPEIWMGMILAAVLAISVLMNFTRRDVAYALVILWALAGISIKHAAVAAVATPTWITFGLVAITLAAAIIRQRPGQKMKFLVVVGSEAAHNNQKFLLSYFAKGRLMVILARRAHRLQVDMVQPADEIVDLPCAALAFGGVDRAVVIEVEAVGQRIHCRD